MEFKRLRYRLFKKYRRRIDIYRNILDNVYDNYSVMVHDYEYGFSKTFIKKGGMCGNFAVSLIEKFGNPDDRYNPIFIYSKKFQKIRRRFYKTVRFTQPDFKNFIRENLPEYKGFLCPSEQNDYGCYWTYRYPVTAAQERIFKPQDFIRMRKEYIRFLSDRLCRNHGIKHGKEL